MKVIWIVVVLLTLSALNIQADVNQTLGGPKVEIVPLNSKRNLGLEFPRVRKCGTGVGSCQLLQSEILNSHLEGLVKQWELSPDITTNASRGVIEVWNSNVIYALQKTKRLASLHYDYGFYQDAFDIIYQSMIFISNSMSHKLSINMREAVSMPVRLGSMTKQMTDRGVVLANLIEVKEAKGYSFDRYMHAKIEFLIGYLDFLEMVAKEFDQPFYITFQYALNRCWSTDGSFRKCPEKIDFNFEAMESKYLELASVLLNLSLKFVNLRQSYDGDFVSGESTETFISGRSYLLLTEYIAHWISRDYQENLYGPLRSCQANTLEKLAYDLREFKDSMGNIPKSVRLDSQIAETFSLVNLIASGRCY